MKNKDKIFQNAVDAIRDELLSCKTEELKCFEHYSKQERNGVTAGIWNHKISENEYHLVVQAQRRVFLFLWRNYLSGIVIKGLSQVDKMPDFHVASYD